MKKSPDYLKRLPNLFSRILFQFHPLRFQYTFRLTLFPTADCNIHLIKASSLPEC